MKPLRPFPFPLNIGTDICRISRIYAILRSPRRGTRFVKRIFAPEEQARRDYRLQCLARGLSGMVDVSSDEIARRDPEWWAAASFVAGRFAAKEAAIKAHSHRRLTFHDVVIERRGRNEERLGSGPPVARIKGRGGEDGGEDASAMISISHDGDYATAVCMAHDPSVVGGGEC
ncbi:uncharacterized protein TRIREDRAFT_56081 [Trichoderma reesei QM6a]|uniref:Predicted protein n=2 Tax=Hypocrea jecorina TaxID=51453 RepID=G0RA25_HYPJQ|nr:uncharacterized protein TRIREDRAFT_56081 [Trichoderma reesei QM6a]EGR51789.1 predicted protein [Trichoderma reesei QM6a]ETS05252.1 hypothetical protein M419DRAFT_72228 [Trichoderma reesei RUT C-30]